MDVFDMANYYEDWFEYAETDPLNSNFEFMGMGDKNFIFNSGSYFAFVAGILVSQSGGWLMNRIAVRFSQF